MKTKLTSPCPADDFRRRDTETPWTVSVSVYPGDTPCPALERLDQELRKERGWRLIDSAIKEMRSLIEWAKPPKPEKIKWINLPPDEMFRLLYPWPKPLEDIFQVFHVPKRYLCDYKGLDGFGESSPSCPACDAGLPVKERFIVDKNAVGYAPYEAGSGEIIHEPIETLELGNEAFVEPGTSIKFELGDIKIVPDPDMPPDELDIRDSKTGELKLRVVNIDWSKIPIENGGCKSWPTDEPCSPGCQGHITHPCEKCGRQWGNK